MDIMPLEDAPTAKCFISYDH